MLCMKRTKWGRSGDGKQRERELDLKRQEKKMCRKKRRLLEPLTWLQTLVEHELFKEIAVAETGQNLMIESDTQKLPQIRPKMMKSGGEELRRDTSGQVRSINFRLRVQSPHSIPVGRLGTCSCKQQVSSNDNTHTLYRGMLFAVIHKGSDLNKQRRGQQQGSRLKVRDVC